MSIWELTDLLFLQQRGTPARLPLSVERHAGDRRRDRSGRGGAARRGRRKRFIDWVGSREALRLAAERAFRLPARNDLPPEELPRVGARRRSTEIVRVDIDWRLLAERGAEWMSRWDREVRGRG